MSTATEAPSQFTAGAIAKTLGVSEAKVKKAIAGLNLEPVAKKGVCNYYGPAQVEQIKAALG
ncbi:hypothetical protein L6V77_20840 [Myxococcota bacterium]|jgi:biotin operon repressor|nr:hypothetical protein [Myxococcota bacterium]